MHQLYSVPAPRAFVDRPLTMLINHIITSHATLTWKLSSKPRPRVDGPCSSSCLFQSLGTGDGSGNWLASSSPELRPCCNRPANQQRRALVSLPLWKRRNAKPLQGSAARETTALTHNITRSRLLAMAASHDPSSTPGDWASVTAAMAAAVVPLRPVISHSS